MMSTRSVVVRVFISLWIVFSVHWATDFVREHFLVLSIAERHTFALDGFEDLHPDIFVHTDGHSYHGANPGISMLGAVPYFVLLPIVDRVVGNELAGRAEDAGGDALYDDPRRARRRFYEEVRARGLDVRFGLIGLITQVFAMAPLSALGGSVLFLLLSGAGLGRRLALGSTLLYAVGTPVLMRSAYLNQNMAVGVVGLIAFALLWNPGPWCPWSQRRRLIVAGFCGGFALLCDYSGGLILALLGLYALSVLLDENTWPSAVRSSLWYLVGAAPPIVALWYYQWSAFGFPFYPPQHYMPPVEWSDLGYQGVAGPQLDLAMMLLFDVRFGLLVNFPVAVLALAAPFLAKPGSFLPRREALLALAVGAAFFALFSSVHYTRLQYITGIRYMVPVIPFLLIAAIPALIRLPKVLTYILVLISIVIGWGMAMGRFQGQESSILETLTRVYLGGFQLPALSTLSRMSAQYLPGSGNVSGAAVLVLIGVVLYGVWTIERPFRPLAVDVPPGGSSRD